jgi:hypothetical protein
MLVSHKIGGLPVLSSIFDHGPLGAALIMIVADFGLVCAFMLLEGIPPWQRSHYKTFLWNDTIFIPLYLYVVTALLERGAAHSGWYTSNYWHYALLCAGCAASIAIEVGAVKGGQYTLSQEFSPSKLWHTLIFGIVAYWILSTLVPAVLTAYDRRDWFAYVLLLVAAAGFFYNSYLDATQRSPEDAHLEGTYVPWEWYRRTN